MDKYNNFEAYIEAKPEWSGCLTKLRQLLVSTELEETIKWGIPCYTINGKNVIGVAAFKDYAGLWFHQGVFLKDDKKVLLNAQEGKTKGLRQWRFKSENEIDEELVMAYILEAIDNQKQGKEIKVERSKKIETDPVLQEAFKQDAGLENAFNTFTPGKQKEFLEYILSAKQEKTKLSRLEKITPMILQGVGLNDKYRK